MQSNTTTMAVSQADAATLKYGYILEPDTLVGTASTEQMQITAINGVVLTLTRAYAGTAVSYAQTTLFRVVGTPINPNSDLGPDMTRARGAKTNYIYRQRLDVNIDSEQIIRSHQGYVPGIQDELGYQGGQRLAEFIRALGQQVIYGYANASGSPTNEFQTMNGLVSWLDGTANSTAVPITTAEALTETVVNTMITNIIKQGAVSKLIAAGPRLVQTLGALYSDTIRREQSDRVRGFWSQVFDPAMANPHEIVMDVFLNDAASNGMLFVLDPDRIFLRPQLGQGLYTIEAPSFRDGDAFSLLGKWSVEVRNSGTDYNYAHVYHSSLL